MDAKDAFRRSVLLKSCSENALMSSIDIENASNEDLQNLLNVYNYSLSKTLPIIFTKMITKLGLQAASSYWPILKKFPINPEKIRVKIEQNEIEAILAKNGEKVEPDDVYKICIFNIIKDLASDALLQSNLEFFKNLDTPKLNAKIKLKSSANSAHSKINIKQHREATKFFEKHISAARKSSQKARFSQQMENRDIEMKADDVEEEDKQIVGENTEDIDNNLLGKTYNESSQQTNSTDDDNIDEENDDIDENDDEFDDSYSEEEDICVEKKLKKNPETKFTLIGDDLLCDDNKESEIVSEYGNNKIQNNLEPNTLGNVTTIEKINSPINLDIEEFSNIKEDDIRNILSTNNDTTNRSYVNFLDYDEEDENVEMR